MSACNTELIARHKKCGKTPARKFTAYCACGHKITGTMCEPCGMSRTPGCLNCWRNGAGHQCPVEFASAECLCGCEEPVGIATRNDTRNSIIKGRPLRFIQGHSTRHLEWRQQEQDAMAARAGVA